MRRKLLMALLVAAAAAVLTVYVAPRFRLNAQEFGVERNRLIADCLYNELDKNLEVPVTIVKTMATNEFLKDFLRSEDSGDQLHPVASMSGYLSRFSGRSRGRSPF
ncbi:MAG: hypothetical protein II932_06535 [Treponema sp.]|nr:hypothetical protein [Treponema sp.]